MEDGTAVLHEDVFPTQINVLVVGDGCDEFISRMFARCRNVYQYTPHRVSDWQGIVRVSHLVSTERLWLHYNFTLLTGKTTHPMVFPRAKGLHQIAILTYLGEDEESCRRAKEMFEKLHCPATDIKSRCQKRIPLSQTMPSISEDLLLLGLWNYPQVIEKVGPTLPVALVSAGFTRQVTLFALLPESKLIYASNDEQHVLEKNDVLVWLFEQYTLLSGGPAGAQILSELRLALVEARKNEAGCRLL